MYIAELKGKLSSRIERSEDVLTSNVFSFFKYAPRDIFLSRLLSLLGINLTDDELDNAEFIFWPTYEDGTEPDLVLLVGRYYILFEAKYFSDFGTDDEKNPEQLMWEFSYNHKKILANIPIISFDDTRLSFEGHCVTEPLFSINSSGDVKKKLIDPMLELYRLEK
jgi:hypothetical protein